MAAYQVLARKWRPKRFDDLVGQEHVVKALQNALAKGRLHHAYLLTGTRGVGKTTIARILAKSLNCTQSSDGEPCGVCPSCTQIDAGRYVDLLEIDAASNTGIDNIREVLENAQYAPTAGKYKVYIIDEVHMLSKSAFNAMLKTLEEPPSHVKFILATTDPQKVPITVLSRCLQFVLRNLTPQQVTERLAHVLSVEGVAADEAALSLLGRAAMGSMRDALSLLDQAIALGSGQVSEADVRHMLGAVDRQYLFALLQHLVNKDGPALMQQAQDMSARAVGFDSALAELAALCQQLALIQAVPSLLSNDDPERQTLLALAEALSAEQLQLYYQCAIHGKKDLPLAPDEAAGFNMTLLRMLAFQPLSAKATPLNLQIQGTALRNPDPTATVPMAEAVVAPVAALAAVQAAPAPAAPEPETVVVEAEAPTPAKVDLPWETAEAAPALESEPEPAPKTAPAVDQAAQPLAAPAPSVPQAAVAETTPEAVVVEANNVEAVLETEPSAPTLNALLPALKPTHWREILGLLSHQLGASQMIANNAVLLRIVADQVVLGLTDQARKILSDDMLSRLAQVLSEAYGQPYAVTTEHLTDGQETPTMQKQREQDERMAQAEVDLAQDDKAQALHQLFDATWIDGSIKPI
ncbi:MAG: DNA polymerase III subunit gamma/tau [Neisseriaceae bacterium]|nr:DNA polymerase III subunit gamma/tau [Neisseriaceae bacterium]MBP6862785.1 DNA polymerase III subunit gamma/tau [Neisseriaceae bacterium]